MEILLQKRSILTVLSLLMTAVLVGFGGGGAAAANLQVVRLVLPHIGSSQNTGGFYSVAVSKGFFADEGIRVVPTTAEGGGANVQVLLAHDADVIMNTGFASVAGPFMRGAPILVVGAGDIGSYGTFWYVKADSPIRNWETDLAGKRIGFSRPGSGSNMTVISLIQSYKKRGITPLPKGVSTGGPPATLAATLTGQVDVGWGTYPSGLKPVEKKKVRVLFQPPDLPGWKHMLVRVIAADPKFLKEHPEAMRGFLRAWQRARVFTVEHPKEAFRMFHAVAGAGMPSAFAIGQHGKYSPPSQHVIEPTKEGIKEAAEVSVAAGFLDKMMTSAQLAKLFPRDYLPKNDPVRALVEESRTMAHKAASGKGRR